MTSGVPRAVVVARATEYEELIARHGTHGQAQFFLQQRERDIAEVLTVHKAQVAAVAVALRGIPDAWRHTRVWRDDLDRFLFEPRDIIVAVGQDGLVANVAKYLHGQPVIGVNPDPARYDGVLVRHAPSAFARVLALTGVEDVPIEHRTMVEAVLDDGQRLLALNEVFVGHRTHQSARYRLTHGKRRERHSSSGLIVSTGTGATGWARSIRLCHRSEIRPPSPTDPALCFFVREAWPSVRTNTDLTEGLVDEQRRLSVVSEMNVGGVVFGDGLEEDRLDFAWGQRLEVRRSNRTLNLVI